MTTQVSPDALTTEQQNELICQRLLSWKRSSILGYWFPSQDHAGSVRTPSFGNWAEAGLILDALTRASIGFSSTPSVYAADKIIMDLGERLQRRLLGPPCIRRAALEYIRSLP